MSGRPENFAEALTALADVGVREMWTPDDWRAGIITFIRTEQARPECRFCGGECFEEHGEWVCRRCDKINGVRTDGTV